jgi:adenylate cyclase class 2
MLVEAELTAVVPDPERMRAALGERAEVERCVYADAYFDRPDRGLRAAGYKVRLRTITTAESTQVLLTYKEPAVDVASGARPEHETEVGDAAVVRTLFAGLGLVEFISFEKHCENYRFQESGREILATVVEIPELPETFLEVETMAAPEDVVAALEVVRQVLAGLGLTDADLCTESYLRRLAAVR